MKKEPPQKITHIDVLQVQEVQDDAIPLPDDWRAKRPLDGAREDGAETHRYRRDADPLVLRQAELHDLCDGKWRENYERRRGNGPWLPGPKKKKKVGNVVKMEIKGVRRHHKSKRLC